MCATYIGHQVTTVLDGKLVTHDAADWTDAIDWASCYPAGFTDGKVRVWYVIRLAGWVVYAKQLAAR